MPEYINPNPYVVHLIGPDGQTIRVKHRQRIVLPEYFERYCARGFIRRVHSGQTPTGRTSAGQTPAGRTDQTGGSLPIQARIRLNRSAAQRRALPSQVNVSSTNESAIQHRKRREELAATRKLIASARRRTIQNILDAARDAATAVQQTVRQSNKPIVGRILGVNPNDLLRANLERNRYPISNNIGVGILSYNRVGCLRRLVDSIMNTTNLQRTTIFISDDGSTDAATVAYLDELAQRHDFVILRNRQRIGIAGNSNRLLRCLSRFAYGILLNDDVEVLRPGWETFYVEAMRQTGMHHFIFRQPGVYGADAGEACQSDNGVSLRRVMERPHGAVLAFSHHFLESVGYFDESYGLYGMEHVDWSQRAWESGLQGPGFYDVEGSQNFFRLHNDKSAVDDRSRLLQEAKRIFDNRTSRRCDPSPASEVPEITYIIPFRNIDRQDSIHTVVSNIRAQRFAVIHIVLCEHDTDSKIDLKSFMPVRYHLAKEDGDRPFNKSKAFNLAVANAPSELLILHDADMLVPAHYTRMVWDVLQENESCHLGNTVIYATRETTSRINEADSVDVQFECERVVGYYEGGSLACTTKAFWRVGGFNEDFWGYGCEDCDFYARLSGGSKWKEDRCFDLLHLWHPRSSDWIDCHNRNRQLENQLKSQTIEQRIMSQRRQKEILGYGEFVAKALQ